MKGSVFAAIAKIGVLLLLVCGILNVYGVVRFIQAHRTLAGFQQQALEASLRRQALDAVLREFLARAGSDPGLQEIFKRAGPQPNRPASTGTAP